MSFDEAMQILSRDERFKATIYAMNTLLLKKGIYTAEEFQELIVEHAINWSRGFKGKTAQQKDQASSVPV